MSGKLEGLFLWVDVHTLVQYLILRFGKKPRHKKVKVLIICIIIFAIRG